MFSWTSGPVVRYLVQKQQWKVKLVHIKLTNLMFPIKLMRVLRLILQVMGWSFVDTIMQWMYTSAISLGPVSCVFSCREPAGLLEDFGILWHGPIEKVLCLVGCGTTTDHGGTPNENPHFYSDFWTSGWGKTMVAMLFHGQKAIFSWLRFIDSSGMNHMRVKFKNYNQNMVHCAMLLV